MGRELAVQFPLMLMRLWWLISHALCWIFAPISYIKLVPHCSQPSFHFWGEVQWGVGNCPHRFLRFQMMKARLKSSNHIVSFFDWKASEKLALCAKTFEMHNPLEIIVFISKLPPGAFSYRRSVYFCLFISLQRIISSLFSLDLQFGLTSLLLPWWCSR